MTYDHVEYLRQPDGVTVVLAPYQFLFVPWSAIKHLSWELPAA
jgi:hypothetical protein